MPPGDRKVSRRNFLSAVASSTAVGATAKATPPLEYPLVRAEGSHRELGRQHGEQAEEKIKAHLRIIRAKGGYSQRQLSDRALAFQPLFEKYCPHLFEEIQGLAEGARIPLAEALAVNIRDPLSLAKVEGCTSFVVAAAGAAEHQILAGKNCDMDPRISSLGYVLHLKPVNKPEVLIWTFGGMIGYHGINSAGVGVFDNALFGDGPANQWGMPHYPLKRMMLECDHADQIIRLYKTVPLAANANYIVCDGHGNILDIEATTAGPEVITDQGTGFLVHTNHYLSPRYPGRKHFEADWKDSFPRLTRMNSLIQAELGSLRVDDFQKFLSDHDGYPTSICRHLGPGDSISVASLIAEPQQRRMHVSYENPCRAQYVSYAM